MVDKMRGLLIGSAALALALFVPDPRLLPAQVPEWRVATLLPPRGMLEAKQWARALSEQTGGELRVKPLSRGHFGEESELLERLRTGELDAAHLSSTTIRQFVRQAMILDAPGLFSHQGQVLAARAALLADFDREALENGFKVIGWQDITPTRIFSKRPVRRPEDLRGMKPWQPDEPVMAELYALLGARGVPLPVGQVLAGLRSDAIDVAYGAAISAMTLQWHTATRYVSVEGGGWVQIALVVRADRFLALSPAAQAALIRSAEQFDQQVASELRRDDLRTYQRLLERGLSAVNIDVRAWAQAGIALRERFVGRLYSRDMLERVKGIAAGH